MFSWRIQASTKGIGAMALRRLQSKRADTFRDIAVDADMDDDIERSDLHGDGSLQDSEEEQVLSGDEEDPHQDPELEEEAAMSSSARVIRARKATAQCVPLPGPFNGTAEAETHDDASDTHAGRSLVPATAKPQRPICATSDEWRCLICRKTREAKSMTTDGRRRWIVDASPSAI